ncbi:hypothetical protein TraAM80_05855 [Trypanosoma rangeli]|uniref:Uncharacterized protein n=1 Tax=Trypanosoma rangeli TaxID=5698 RepID=A0A3R7NIY2_TRYRA|nr:uncharacterized protein TraAM80_05855 [Trypanosoma rangeli]RNF03292.1 hypothetical protein TraAM80_05855 [Trypanosoma rangeli]|eukprot:RNF03292.1 hypothetical protein TraAM80_05855 [Trypanosoma rangeli]
MTVFDLADMTVTYVQYIYILVSISPMSFPDFYVEPFRSLRYVSLEFVDRLSKENYYSNPLGIKLPDWLPLDYRLQFAFIAVFAPFLASLVGVLTVCSTLAFGGLLLVLASLFSMVFGAVLLAHPWIYSVYLISKQTRVLLLSVGAATMAVLILIGALGFHFWRLRRMHEQEAIMEGTAAVRTEPMWGTSLAEKAVTRSETNLRALAALTAHEDSNRRYLRRCRLAVTLPQFIMAVVVLMVGVLFIGLPPIRDIRFFQESPVGHTTGSILLLVGLMTFVWAIFGVFRAGRRLQLKMYDLLSSTMLGIMLVVISFIYSPVLMNMINILWCVEVKCGAKEWIGPPGSISSASGNSPIWGTLASPCSPCNFSVHAQNCPAALQTQLCGNAVAHSLLAYDSSVPCSEVNAFYKVTVLVILLSYTVGYPIFLVVVADRGTIILEREYPLDKRLMDEFTEKELYYEKVRKSVNVSAPVYQAYRRSYRKARLTFLLQRVLLVTIGCLTSKGIEEDLAWIGLALVLVVCMLYFLYTTLLHPYARPVENIYGATQQFTIVCVASVGVVGQRLGRHAIPFGVAVLLAVFVCLAPLVALIVGLVRTFQNDRERAKRLRRRLENGFAVESKTTQGRSFTPEFREDGDPLNVTGGNRASLKDGGNRAFGGGAARAESPEGQGERDSPSRTKRLHNSSASGTKAYAAKPLPREVWEAGMSSLAGPNYSYQQQRQSNLQEGSCLDFSPESCDEAPRRLHHLQEHSAQGAGLVNPRKEEPSGLTSQLSGWGDAGIVRAAAPSASQQSPVEDVNYGAQFPGDDYFKDARPFVPAAYFGGFDDALLLITGDAGGKEVKSRKQLRVKGDGWWSGEGTFRNIFTFFNTLRGQLTQWNTTGQKEPTDDVAEGLKSTILHGGTTKREGGTKGEQELQEVTENAKNHSTTLVPRKSAFFRCWKRWRKALNISGTSLRYAEVLEERRRLQKSAGVQGRPFWLEPSETQQQTYNVPGSSAPSYCARNNRVVAFERNAAGEPTAFARLKAHKNLHHPPIVVEHKQTQAFPGPPSPTDNKRFRFGDAETNSLENEVEIQLSSSRKRSSVDQASTDSAASPKGKLQESLVSLVGHRSEGHLEESYGTQKRKHSSSAYTRFECISNAERQLQKLEQFCERELQATYDGVRRPTVFAPVYPKVHLEGVEVTDWDEFTQQLLAEIYIPRAGSVNRSSSFSRRAELEDASEYPPLKADAATNKSPRTSGGTKRRTQKRIPSVSIDHDTEAVLRPLHIASTTPKRVKLLLRHFILRRRLTEVFKEQRSRLRALQQAVDFRIAGTIKKYMQWFFLALSVCTTVALVFCLCGMLQGKKSDFVDGVWRSNSVEHELMGYDSWETFTQHCCCLSKVNLTATFPYYLLDVENWLCDDGRVKQRVRRDAYESTVVSGYSVRELCGMTFHEGCYPFVTPDNRVKLLGCSSAVTEMEKKRW